MAGKTPQKEELPGTLALNEPVDPATLTTEQHAKRDEGLARAAVTAQKADKLRTAERALADVYASDYWTALSDLENCHRFARLKEDMLDLLSRAAHQHEMDAAATRSTLIQLGLL